MFYFAKLMKLSKIHCRKVKNKNSFLKLKSFKLIFVRKYADGHGNNVKKDGLERSSFSTSMNYFSL